nr:uncharacterized protein LOC115268838 [Aedes albopictus]
MNLYAANGSRIATYGTEIYKPTFDLRRCFPWRFIIADVTSPILGADFLKHYGLLVDLQGECLIDKMTSIKAHGQISVVAEGLFGLKTYSRNSDYGGLLSEFSDVTRPRFPRQEVKHGVKHTIKVDGPPCHSKFRRLPPHKLEALRKELKLFLELGYIRSSKSPYSSPVHLATKTLQNGDVKFRLVVQAVANFPKPDTVQKLRRFLALVNYYRRFLSHASEVEIPLRKLIPSNRKNDNTPIVWTAEAEAAFEKCKRCLVEATELDYYDPEAQLSLMVDASDLAAGAVLQQRYRGAWKPLGYFSVKFNDRERRYSTYDSELLAVYLGVKHFKDVIEGCNPVIFTDHKPLTFAFKQDANKPTTRQQRMLSFISEYTTDLVHIAVVDHIPADVLSRVEAIWLPSTINQNDFAWKQECNEQLQNWHNVNPDVKTLKFAHLGKWDDRVLA